MDKTEANKDFSEDSTRESLIALSYGVPQSNQPAAMMSPKSRNGEKAGETSTRDGEEKCRSELISISYSPSPDMKEQPSLPVAVEFNG